MTYPDNEWTRALRKGIEGAHDCMRFDLRMARQHPGDPAYFIDDARKAHTRARWYIARLRDQRNLQPTEIEHEHRNAA